MKLFSKIIIAFIVGLTTLNISGQTNDTAKMNGLIVYGDSFIFSVKEPDSWIGDINNAKQFHANIIFYKNKADFENGGALIQVYNFKKQDEQTENDLQYDIKSYQKEFNNLKQQDITVAHKEYKCFSRLAYVDNNFYQYIVYLNCGKQYKSGLSVAMNISKRPATEDELKAFRDIIFSLLMFKG